VTVIEIVVEMVTPEAIVVIFRVYVPALDTCRPLKWATPLTNYTVNVGPSRVPPVTVGDVSETVAVPL
jgi:hypothetical protein